MQAELTLNTKCPACGHLKPKTLAAIKAQTVVDCDCGFHADVLQAKAIKRQRKSRAAATA